ncbi:Ribosomal RNA large subunit methyltransferase N [Labilithrix luteola]|uniref:Probable dual-specificity RNA methyltransferase RlmN n=1 Tax=Labilithrix luteola TaxID=1391654 RepID=A0A0K1Q7N0_9BACT|nr:23S rRNA (adenine(2503)-C(2))-methyltransferase RlmN [Labilithrix luteola]AKV01743.1 Ribosomal RNA large subunit methyltransferase N [Labilithrix luteola]
MPASNAAQPIQPIARFPEEWAQEVVRLGGRTFHGKQVFRWIQARGMTDPNAMSDLPAALRTRLAEEGLGSVLSIVRERRATDDTRKLLVGLGDGANVETVLIPRVTGGKSDLPSPVPMDGGDADAAAAVEDEDEEPETSNASIPVTQCISTQVGCAMGCVFCASGVAGLKRHMRPDEIVAQVLVGKSRLDAGERLSNIVLMGMGEPLHNYESTLRALRLITHPEGIALSTRKVTVSTSGLVPEIARLGQDFNGQIGLAISLHAADDETRSRLMPINKKYPLAALMKGLREYPLPRRRRITIEYTLVAGKNDTIDEAKKLSKLLRGLPVKVNLIPMNPIEASTLGPPDLSGVLAFQRVLCDAGYSCFIRRRRGDDVSAACGQLALLGAKPKVRVNRS